MIRSLLIILYFVLLFSKVLLASSMDSSVAEESNLSQSSSRLLDLGSSSNPELKIRELSQSLEWLRLLHASIDGISKIRGEKFFISARGDRDPLGELNATFLGLSADTSEGASLRCRFPARREFLLQHFSELRETLPVCPEREAWIQRLNPQSVSWVFASGYLSSAASSFGHTFLVIHRKDSNSPLLDYAVNYSARTGSENGALFALKGLFGFYPGQFALLPYHQMIKDYQNLEGRDLFEFPLDFTDSEVKFLIYHLMELEQGSIDYYFIDQNCSSLLTEVLAAVRPRQIEMDWNPIFTIPIETIKENQGQVGSPIPRDSLLSQFHDRWDRLKGDEQDFARWLMEKIRGEGPLPSLDEMKDEIKREAGRTLKVISAEKEGAREQLSEIIDVIPLWFATRGPEKSGELRKKIFTLTQMRSQMGESSSSQNASISSAKESPLDVHDPGQIRFGIRSTKTPGNSNRTTSYSLSFQPLYHDFISPSQGMPLGREVKLLDIEFLLKDSSGKRSLNLNQLTFISMFNPLPLEPFDRPLSWGFSVGYQPLLTEGGQALAHGEMGYSISLMNRSSLLAGLLRTQIGSSTEAEGHLRLGPELLLVSRISSRQMLTSRFYSGYSMFKGESSALNSAIIEYSYSLNLQQSLRVGLSSETLQSSHENEIIERDRSQEIAKLDWVKFF